ALGDPLRAAHQPCGRAREHRARACDRRVLGTRRGLVRRLDRSTDHAPRRPAALFPLDPDRARVPRDPRPGPGQDRRGDRPGAVGDLRVRRARSRPGRAQEGVRRGGDRPRAADAPHPPAPPAAELPAAARRARGGAGGSGDYARGDALVPRPGAADHAALARTADRERLQLPALGPLLGQRPSPGPAAPPRRPLDQPGRGPAARAARPARAPALSLILSLRTSGGGTMKKGIAALALLFACGTAGAQGSKPLEVIAFGGGGNWPVWAAQDKGLFAKNGIAVNLSFTPNSVEQIRNLMSGKYDFGTTAYDNVVAYQEGQGETELSTPPDLFAFMGGYSGSLRFVTSPDVKTYAALKGKTVGVDAATTGFAFILYKLAAMN